MKEEILLIIALIIVASQFGEVNLYKRISKRFKDDSKVQDKKDID